MKRFRVLAVILAVLMLPIALLIGCQKTNNPGSSTVEPCKNHKWGTWQRVQTRACTTDGIRVRLCDKCGEQEIERTAAYGHDLADYVSDNNATCTEDGTKSKRCKLCEYRETAEDPGSAKGHVFVTYKPAADGFTESALCIKCGDAVDTKLLGLTIDFEGDKSHLSYSAFDVFTGALEDASEYKTENGNSYLSISRPEGAVIGGGEFGVVLTPRADILKSGNIVTYPSYVVEFDVRIDREKTGDLVLLSGTKQNSKENFIKYNSETGTIESNIGPVYDLKDSDYGTWLRIAAVLNDGTKKYDIYIGKYLYESGIDYLTVDGYYMGYDVDRLTIAMVNGEYASSFDVDNIKLYLGRTPNDSLGTATPGYGVYVATNGEKIVYKLPADGCSHSYTSEVIAPGCVTCGYTLETCAACGGQKISAETAPVDHKFEVVGTTPATCFNPELERSECSVCGARNAKETAPALGHTLDESNPELLKVTTPTCIAAGYSVGPCVRCGMETEGAYTAALGHEANPDSFETKEPTCTEKGVTTAKCIRCESVMEMEVTAALGHTCSNPVTKAPTCTTAGVTNCVCDRCELAYEINAVPALGHQLVSEIANSLEDENVKEIHTYCTRCDEVDNRKPLSGEVPPTLAEMEEALGSAGFAYTSSGLNYCFDKVNVGVYGKIDGFQTGPALTDFVSRFGTLEVKRARDGRYAEWAFAPTNDKNNQGRHTYFQLNFNGGKSTKGKTYVLDISLRRTKGEADVLPIVVGLEDRTNSAVGNVGANLIQTQADGSVVLVGAKDRPLAYLKEDVWTKFSMVVHPNVGSAATFDVYVDGVLVVTQALIQNGEPNKKSFDETSFFRIQVADQSKEQPTRKIDLDEVYLYYADIPVYVTDVDLIEGSLISGSDVSSNLTKEVDGNTYSYLDKNTLGKGVDFNGKDHTQFFLADFDGKTGLRVIKNDSIPNLYPDAGNDSHITSWGYNLYASTLLEMQICLNEGTDMTGAFTIFQGRRQVGDSSAAQTFLVFNNGWLEAANGDKIIQVEAGKWYTVAVVIREGAMQYDVYVDGYMHRESLPFTTSNYASSSYSAGVAYKFMNLTASDVDVSLKNINFQGGAQAPTLNLGKYETVYVETEISSKPVTIVEFWEGYNYNHLYSGSSEWIGKEKFTTVDGKSYLEISTTNKDSKGLALVKVDSQGKMGDEAGEDAVWTLRTGDWATKRHSQPL